MEFAEKVPYTPSQIKRFEVSCDRFSRERVQMVHKIVHDVRRIHPFVVGAVIFGSLSKGKVLTEEIVEKSDVDLAIFIDPQLLKENPQGLSLDNEIYREAFELMSDLNMYEGDQMLLMTTVLYLEDLIDRRFRKSLSPENKLPDEEKWGSAFMPISLCGEDSLENAFKRQYEFYTPELIAKKLEEADINLDPKSCSILALPWGLDILGGLKRYRRSFLDYLGELNPNVADLYWKAIIDSIKFYERSRQIPPNIQKYYPESYQQALKYYK